MNKMQLPTRRAAKEAFSPWLRWVPPRQEGKLRQTNTVTFLPSSLVASRGIEGTSGRTFTLATPAGALSAKCYYPLVAQGGKKKKDTPQFPLIHPESMLLKNLTHIWLKSQSMHFMF